MHEVLQSRALYSNAPIGFGAELVVVNNGVSVSSVGDRGGLGEGGGGDGLGGGGDGLDMSAAQSMTVLQLMRPSMTTMRNGCMDLEPVILLDV